MTRERVNLPNLANIFALSCSENELPGHKTRMEESGLFHEVTTPAPDWVVGIAPLPGSEWSLDGNPRTFWTEGIERFPSDGSARLLDDASFDPGRLGSFDGDFGFLHFLENGRLLATRSCGGRVPLYVWDGPGFTIVSTLLTYVARLAPRHVEMDPLPNATWSTGWTLFPDGRTFFRDVRIVERGGCVLVGKGSPAYHSYWDPRPDRVAWPSRALHREHAHALRSILLDHLSTELDTDGRNVLTFSGGIDSSSLAALAVGQVGRQISTVSFIPDREPFLSAERVYLESIKSTFDITRAWEFPLTYDERIRLLHEAPDVAFPVFHPALGAITEVLRQQDVRVLFGGEFADEVCGSRFTFPDWVRDVGPIGLIRTMGSWPSGPRILRRWVGHRARAATGRVFLPFPTQPPRWVRDEVRDEYRAWRAQRAAELLAEPPLAYLALHAEADGFVAMNWEALSFLGIRRSWPFFNRAVLELAFQCHPVERVGPGVKKLLRVALESDVPTLNLHRPSRGTWPPEKASLQVPGLGPAFASTFDATKLAGGGRVRADDLFAGWVFAGFEAAVAKTGLELGDS